MKHISELSQKTTLFLDRDGVINKRIVDGYVTREEDFVLIDGVVEAMTIFAKRFKHIFIVTNQQGIGKGLMSENDLSNIHAKLLAAVHDRGGRIDHIYYCAALKSDHSFMRKPSIGMALQARRDYPEVVLKNAIMVGDTKSDMLFGRRAKMTTVLVGEEQETAQEYPWLVDYAYADLFSFAKTL